MSEFSHRVILQRHIQRLDESLQEEHSVDELVRLSDALERAVSTYDRLEN